MKRIYSLNLISYLRTKGFTETGIHKDEENGKYYYTFEDSQDVVDAILEYKSPNAEVNLHNFIVSFKAIKRDIYNLDKSN